MIILISLIVILTVTVFVFTEQAMFGKVPSGERLELIKKSPNFRNGQFQNLNPTPMMTEDASTFSIFMKFFFGKKVRVTPIDSIPSMKTDLLNLNQDENVLVWFGHSSYFMQIDGKKILVDPVFSGAASPVSFTTRAFKGTDQYSPNDMPEIDYLFISHDHWDHLDYETVLKLKKKVKKVICGLGVGEHLEQWGYEKNKIIEKDWNDEVKLDDGFEVVITPSRHFSGRAFNRNKSLWVSFVLKTPTSKIYLGGDSGYDTHFAEIGNKYGGFDFAILENGQYDKNWKYIHMHPEQVLQAAQDLKAERIFTVHSSKFALGNHPWDEPLIRVNELNKQLNIPLIFPIIGEKVVLSDTNHIFKHWWLGLR